MEYSPPGPSLCHACCVACANGHASPCELAGAAPGLQGLLARAGERLGIAEAVDAGRCLVVDQALPAGTDVLRERPLVHALTKLGRRLVSPGRLACLPDCLPARPPAPPWASAACQGLHTYGSSQPFLLSMQVCATCLASLTDVAAPFYCRRCPVAVYCSAACRDGDASHLPGGPECGRPWPVLLPPDAVAALRLARRLRTAGASSAEAQQVAALGTHFSELPAEDLVELAALAALAHAIWQLAVAEADLAAGNLAAQQAAAAAAGIVGDDIMAGEVLEALCRLQVGQLPRGVLSCLSCGGWPIKPAWFVLCICGCVPLLPTLLSFCWPAVCRSMGWRWCQPSDGATKTGWP